MYSIKLDLVFEKSEIRCQIRVHSKKLVCKKKFTQRSKEVNLEEQNHCPKSKEVNLGLNFFAVTCMQNKHLLCYFLGPTVPGSKSARLQGNNDSS